ncbi:hypoxia induced protein conserved region-domain-containing protein [Apiosordaria backusii]|uniref:Hypoxia induced protein conserved region-domain-containing protein n=1 Tax=Apiosordaria backusii TaxID=314023 RepID=A0AA40DS90_9PEZI|nr:hypoxia induced protein conserved region-domain-containing protein [Apiosordaria backusii]
MSNGPLSNRPLPSSFDGNEDFYNENGFQKVIRRLKEEPLVPIGCLLTVAAFINAYRAMRRGDHVKVQKMFRARVAAQGFTVVAMVAGGMYYQEDRHKRKELWKLQQQKDAEEKHQKWIKELEARDAEEKALQERLDKRRRRAAERAGGTGTEAVAAQARAALRESKVGFADTEKAETADVAPAEANNSSGGVLGSLGGWFGGSKKAPEDSTPALESRPEDPKK